MKKRKKRKLKKNIKRMLFTIILLIICFFLYSVFYKSFNITNIEFEKNKLLIKYTADYENIYCALSPNDTIPSFEDKMWIKGVEKVCTINVELNSSYKLYIRNSEKIIFKNTYNSLVYYDLNNVQNQIYIAPDGMYNPQLDYLILGNASNKLFSRYDNNIIEIENNLIVARSVGNTALKIGYKDNSKIVNIIVTDLITDMPTGFDFNKKHLKCNQYTKEENDLLDNILKSRVNEAGYKTRAAALAAARFLTLEFPYRIDYFYENGRIAFRSSKVDGEGRYYHTGLYLSEDRKSNIKYKQKGPAAWGCTIYNTPAKRNMSNGLDCSGFVSWVLLNAGFDPGDIGAGITDVYDLTDTGKRAVLTYSLANSNNIKAGDLLWKNAGGGHIAIIVGIDDKNYYAAEALWDGYPETGVIINKYPKSSINSKYKYVILMDTYYKEEGNYSKLWY